MTTINTGWLNRLNQNERKPYLVKQCEQRVTGAHIYKQLKCPEEQKQDSPNKWQTKTKTKAEKRTSLSEKGETLQQS